MSLLKNSSSFCLFCYKNTDSSIETGGNSASIKIFTKILNRLTKIKNTDADIFEDRLLEKVDDIKSLLIYCNNCKEIVQKFCEIFHTIKTLEIQLNWQLDKLKKKVSHANKVPSRWVNVSMALGELYRNDPSKKPATQITIRDFRQNVVRAADYRKQKSQPRVSLERKEYFEEVTKLINSDHWTGVKLRENYKDNRCPVCGKEFSSLIRLQYHMKYHKLKQELKAECSKCKKKFPTNYSLRIHMKSHIREKLLKCPFGPTMFAYKSSLIRHLLAKHGNEKGLEKELKRKWNDNLKHPIESYIDDDDDQVSSADSFNEDMPTNENDERNSLGERRETNIFVDPIVKVEPSTCLGANDDDGETSQNTLTEPPFTKGFKASGGMENICCEFCKKSFPGIAQLSKHINEDSCPENKAGNETFSEGTISEVAENGTCYVKNELFTV